MSLNTMTNAALARRSDYPPANGPPRSVAERVEAAKREPTPPSALSTSLTTLTTYIPTEVITLYVAVVAMLQSTASTTSSSSGNWMIFWSFLAFTPAAIWLTFATKLAADRKRLPLQPLQWPKWEMLAGTLSYTAWAVALPNSPFAQLPWYSSAVGGGIVLVTGTLLGMIAPLFQRELQMTDAANGASI